MLNDLASHILFKNKKNLVTGKTHKVITLNDEEELVKESPLLKYEEVRQMVNNRILSH